jgi:two-component system chemotaxis response regulator CheY
MTEPGDKAPGRVVVVDDSAFLAKEIAEFLSGQMGLDVVGVGRDGVEAVELYRSLRPDLITMDLTMPVKDGKTALQEILMEFPDASILVISAVRGKTVVECLKLGIKGYVEKPLKFANPLFIEEFKASVREALDG